MVESFEHIRWRRLPDISPRRTRRGFGGGPPLRSDINKHGKELKEKLEVALSVSDRARQAGGIDPSRLLVLSFLFAESDERELLEKLGLQVVQERESRQEIEEPYYVVSVKFDTERHKRAFEKQADQHGVIKFDYKRDSSGDADPVRLDVRFADLNSAKAFQNNKNLQHSAGIEKASTPSKRSSEVSYGLLVQFPDKASLEQFKREFSAYGQDVGDSAALTQIQRQRLFDAIENVYSLQPADRRGGRLASEGLPKEREFYVDVDLWHPGSPGLIREAIQQFEKVVKSAGGTVTDQPYPVAGTLLLARVKGYKRTLEVLLAYDRVARVDLPPILKGIEFSTWANIDGPKKALKVAEDGPLACIVDSGVVASHPMLSGIIVDERDFDSGERSVIDRVGHGTHVAGIVAYGDIQECVRNNQWEPKVRLLSAKVMKLVPNMAGGPASAGFADEERVETQLRNALTTFNKEYNCRVFNLSLGNSACPYGQGGQLPWAYVLDDLAKQLDVVIVVAAGNVTNPGIPQANTEPEFQQLVREQLFTREHTIIDPASSVMALTAGAISRPTAPLQAQRNAGRREIVGSPGNCPAPFTRTSIVDSTGDGLRRVIKPELVAFGGNYSLAAGHGRWNINDPGLGEVSLKHDHQAGRLLSASNGTSAAAPYITHVAALVEERLRKRADQERAPSANLIRALVVHSGDIPQELEDWLTDGFSEASGEERILRAAGYGKPNSAKAMFSQDNRAVLFAEDTLTEDHFHLYELELPQDFIDGNRKRRLKITLAYDPPVSGTRKEYLARTMWFELYRGLTADQIRQGRSAASGGTARVSFGSNEVKVRPTYTTLQWSTVQSATFVGQRQTSFEYRANAHDPVVWHVLVGSTHRFDMGAAEEQDYALVVSLEHSDERAKILIPVRQRNIARVRQHWS